MLMPHYPRRRGSPRLSAPRSTRALDEGVAEPTDAFRTTSRPVRPDLLSRGTYCREIPCSRMHTAVSFHSRLCPPPRLAPTTAPGAPRLPTDAQHYLRSVEPAQLMLLADMNYKYASEAVSQQPLPQHTSRPTDGSVHDA
jgi:hypothetical protein